MYKKVKWCTWRSTKMYTDVHRRTKMYIWMYTDVQRCTRTYMRVYKHVHECKKMYIKSKLYFFYIFLKPFLQKLRATLKMKSSWRFWRWLLKIISISGIRSLLLWLPNQLRKSANSLQNGKIFNNQFTHGPIYFRFVSVRQSQKRRNLSSSRQGSAIGKIIFDFF